MSLLDTGGFQDSMTIENLPKRRNFDVDQV